MKKHLHWFYTDDRNSHYAGVINTYGLGNHPTQTYHYELDEDYQNAIKRFLDDDYHHAGHNI